MSKIKVVKFDYVRVYSCVYDIENRKKKLHQPFKLEDLLNLGLNKDISERTATYYGEKVILQTIEHDQDIWKLQFVKQRAAELPGIIKESTNEFKKLDLDDDEYIGEEVSALYDEKTNVLMIQRNRNALGTIGIQKFFNNTLKDKDNVIELKPVPFTNNVKELKNMKLRKLEVSFADVKKDTDNENSSLINLIIGSKKMQSLNTKVSFSVGRGGSDKSLVAEEIEEFINLTKDDGFNKIHLEYKPEEDAPLEIVELINGILVDDMKMEYSKENAIDYKRVIEAMTLIFRERRPYLLRIFNTK